MRMLKKPLNRRQTLMHVNGNRAAAHYSTCAGVGQSIRVSRNRSLHSQGTHSHEQKGFGATLSVQPQKNVLFTNFGIGTLEMQARNHTILHLACETIKPEIPCNLLIVIMSNFFALPAQQYGAHRIQPSEWIGIKNIFTIIHERFVSSLDTIRKGSRVRLLYRVTWKMLGCVHSHRLFIVFSLLMFISNTASWQSLII